MNTLSLVYRGPLKSNGDAKHKADIRGVFSEQLQVVYERDVSSSSSLIQNYAEKIFKTVGGAKYTSLANRLFGLKIQLSVTVLAPGEQSVFASSQGDLDNRLKTLFDALSIPPESQGASIKVQLPELTVCLVEDDRLIHDVRIRMAELLAPKDKNEVMVFVEAVFVRHDPIANIIYVD